MFQTICKLLTTCDGLCELFSPQRKHVCITDENKCSSGRKSQLHDRLCAERWQDLLHNAPGQEVKWAYCDPINVFVLALWESDCGWLRTPGNNLSHRGLPWLTLFNARLVMDVSLVICRATLFLCLALIQSVLSWCCTCSEKENIYIYIYIYIYICILQILLFIYMYIIYTFIFLFFTFFSADTQ